MKLEKVSASQISLFEQCPRKWWYNYVLKEKTPSTPSQELGTAIHAELEEYVVTNGGVDVSARAKPALEHLPRNYRMIAEHEFFLPTFEGGPMLHGFVDLHIPKIGTVLDYKTTSDFKYCKTQEELRTDTQMMVYAWWAYTRWLSLESPLTIGHVYIRTKGAPASRMEVVTVNYDHVSAAWKKRMDVVKRMQVCAALGSVDEAEANPLACGLYGGCYFRSKCTVQVGGVKSLFALQESRMSLASKLANKQANKIEAAVTAVEEHVAVGINPPDATSRMVLPPVLGDGEGPPAAAAAEGPATALAKRRGRPPKNRDAVPITTPVPGTTTVIEKAQEIEKVRPEAPDAGDECSKCSGSFSLYVDCYPVKGKDQPQAVLFEVWAAPLFERIADANEVKDFRLIDYGKWKGPFAVMVADKLVGGVPEVLIVSSYAAGAHEALEVLMPHARSVVRALKG